MSENKVKLTQFVREMIRKVLTVTGVILTVIGLGMVFFSEIQKIQTAMGLTIFIIGLAVIILAPILRCQVKEEEEKKECITLPNDQRNRLLKEYETLNQIVQTRERSALLAGSIFISASLLIFARTATSLAGNPPIKLMAFASLGFYAIWLGFWYTSHKLDEICYDHMRKQLERKLCIKVHTRIYEKVGCELWYQLRRNIWYIFFVFLLTIWLILLHVQP